MNIFELLKKYDIHPKKKFGQNFLIATPTLVKIVETLRVTKDDKVVEIGPGPGCMTELLADRAKFVAAIETDPKMVSILEKEMGERSNLQIIHGDVLRTNFDKLLEGPDKWLFAGNIPYNITSPILFHLRSYRERFSRGVLTVQKEVAERLVAGPGTKDYGILSIALQAVADVEIVFNISPSSFLPAPKVESSLVEINFDDAPDHGIQDLESFTRVVRAAFSTRRKKMKNALLQSALVDLSKEKIESAMETANIPPNARAEELDIRQFAVLAGKLYPTPNNIERGHS